MLITFLFFKTPFLIILTDLQLKYNTRLQPAGFHLSLGTVGSSGKASSNKAPRSVLRGRAQSTELIRGPSELVIGGVHVGARALHVLTLIWFGCIARLSQWGGGG